MPGFRWPRALAAVTAAVALAACAAGCTASSPQAARPPAATRAAPAPGAGTATGGTATGGTAAGTPVAGTPVAGTPAVTAKPPATLARYYAQRLAWHACDQGFECAQLLVPMDYARPAWRRFTLPVIKLPAAGPARKVGALVINPGGPGGSGVQYALAARSQFTANIRDRFDIVGFDPRGVGGSQPAVRCMSGPQLDKFFATDDMPANAAQFATITSESKLYASECAKNAAALLPYVGTVNAAKDMDVLRAALGESALTYLGKSYGTDLGASYARQFPSRVRALVLDGAVDPSLPGLQLDVAQASGFESAFGQFTAWCAGQSGCPFRKNVPGAAAKTAGLIAQASRHPLASELGGDQPADGAMLLTGIASALYARPEWPTLKSALSEAFGGDGTVLVELADILVERSPNGTYSNLTDVETSVDCVDRPWPRSLTAWRAAAASAAKAAPLFGAALVWGSLPCAYWPVTASQSPMWPKSPKSPTSGTMRGRGTGARPILVVGDLHDPATPYRWAQSLSRQLTAGVLLGWNGEGHTSYMEGSSCVNDTVDTYLIILKTPRTGTICS
jgi:pimeloyl-ACP methyl ester carboxylesterase